MLRDVVRRVRHEYQGGHGVAAGEAAAALGHAARVLEPAADLGYRPCKGGPSRAPGSERDQARAPGRWLVRPSRENTSAQGLRARLCASVRRGGCCTAAAVLAAAAAALRAAAIATALSATLAAGPARRWERPLLQRVAREATNGGAGGGERLGPREGMGGTLPGLAAGRAARSHRLVSSPSRYYT